MYCEELFGTEEIETCPPPEVQHTSLTTNDNNIIATTPTDTISANNVMGISEHDIEGRIYLLNSLFIEKEHQS